MRVLITGGAGFVGSHLAESLLDRGDEVFILDDLSTGSIDNIAHLKAAKRFSYVVDSVTSESLLAGNWTQSSPKVQTIPSGDAFWTGVTVTIGTANGTGWSSTASHNGTTKTCELWIGTVTGSGNEGTPTCT